ncbi:unnamed protein product [Polarella glacialis]|uniref:Beta-lactamase-related domain-containing protein n=1 Tax=Polarella glacialis TaxID=89957 RepID=A0A813KYW8_POLGL|nr:unnamed protein product [Polarella glacialis]
MLKLAKAPYQSMEELFRAGRWSIPPAIEYNASDITVRHLLSMLSGIRDFDTAGYRDFQYAIPSLDVSPLQVFDWAQGPLMFKPGGPIANSTGRPPVGFNYCSVNFMLLGYILAYFSGAQNWLDYDQASVVPAALRARMEGLAFSKSGSCSKMTRVHGYDMASVRKPYDVSNISCLGGWTAGNVVMPTLAAAEWSRALWGPRSEVVPRDLVDEMVSFQNGSAYGLATMNMGRMSGLGFLGDYGVAVGHLGDTYGYTSIVTYFPKIDVAIAIATNHEDNVQAGPRALLCTAYNRALDIMLGRALRNCSYVNGGYFMGGCKCEAHSGAARAEILI